MRRHGSVSAAALAVFAGTAAVVGAIGEARAQTQLPQITVTPPKQKAPPKKAATKPAPKAEAEPAGDKAKSAAGPLAKGGDVTIGKAELDKAQPSTVQGLFAAQSAVTVGGTTQASTKVYVHGIEETMLNVTVDGAKQPQRSGFHHNGSYLIDPGMLKAVAVDAGASAADAGPHALGGAVRYMTKDAADLLLDGQKLGAFATLSYDTNSGTIRRSGAVYGKSGGFQVLAYGLWADGDNYKDGSGAAVNGTEVDLVNYLGKLSYESVSGHRIAVSAEHISDEGLRPFRANLLVGGPAPAPYSYNEATRDTYTFEYRTTRPTVGYDPVVSFYSNKTRLYRPHAGTCAPGDLPPAPGKNACVAFGEVDIDTIGGKAQNTFTLGAGKLTAGVDFYQEEASVDHFGGTPVLGEKLSNFGAYVQYRFQLFSKTRVSAGVRVDHNQLDAADGQVFETTGVSPNISVEHDLTRQWTLKASYGYSFGGIPLYETFLIRPGNPFYSPGLNPQYGQTSKAGVQFKEGGLLAEATVFSTRIIDPVCPNCAAPEPVANVDDITSRGVDLSLKYAWANGLLALNYTHTQTEFGPNPLTTTSYYYGTPLGDILKVYGHYQLPGTGVTVGFLSQFAFEYDGIADLYVNPASPALGTYGVLDAYSVHNVFAQWTPESLPKLTLRAEVLNIFDADYVDRATAVGGTLVPLKSPGRTFLFSGKVKF